MRALDLSGLTFGQLTVGSLARTQTGRRAWNCTCSCGNKIIAMASGLRSGTTKSCGKHRRLNIVGQTFGRWTVLERIESHPRRTHFRCRCACGTERVVNGSALVRGHSTSCGCSNIGRPKYWRRKPEEGAFNKLIGCYRRNAEARGHRFLLSKAEALRLFKAKCAYCGASPSNVCVSRFRSSTGYMSKIKYSGLDRIDNGKDYTLGNVVSCCWVCNRRKWTSSRKQFLAWARRVAKRQGWIKK